MSEEKLNIALQIVKKAGEYLRSHFGTVNIQTQEKQDFSVVTEFDLTSSEMIVSGLKQAFPDYRILSEEDDNAEKFVMDDQPTWILDPLDGTSNFVAGLPLFGIALALVIKKEPVIGIIYDPVRDDMFYAEKGRGTKINGRKITVSKHKTLKKAMLLAGRGHREKDRIRHGKIIFELEKITPYFRRFGSAAVMLSSVAAGRADAVILTGSQAWDLAAGALLVQEAGGKVTEYCGKPWKIGSVDLVATNGVLHDQLINITKERAPCQCREK